MASTTPDCTLGNWNWLGTDDQARDVLARVIYGFRISVLFGLILTLGSAVIGVSAGAVGRYPCLGYALRLQHILGWCRFSRRLS